MVIVRYDKNKVSVGEIIKFKTDKNFGQSVLELTTRFGIIIISIADLQEIHDLNEKLLE